MNGRVDQLSEFKRALLDLKEMRGRLDELKRSRNEPIAIIGMGCRFPGGIKDEESFWKLLESGTNAVREVPSSRWNLDDYYHPDPRVPGKIYCRHGAFLDDVDMFEPGFFDVKRSEAVNMDPQHRLLLETSWEALETAGIVPESLVGSQTGVYMAMCSTDYKDVLRNVAGEAAINSYAGTGNLGSVGPGRISYFLGLNGPSIAVDTACSSSLVTVHQACQSLRSGETDLALAGGVNLILTPIASQYFSRLQLMSAKGQCRSFDADADGYVRGEGCGVVVLKRLSDALRDGDPIQAVIRGSAVNQDGRSNGITAPSGPAQQAVIKRALANAGVKPEEVGYIEAHGTGTVLGDPIEAEALGAVFGSGHTQDTPLLMGSVKTNFGHTEGSAGIAGLLKVVLVLKNKAIPPSLNFEKPSTYIRWDELPLRVVTGLTPWKDAKGPRIAGVSSFGISGTNAHIVLEEAPQPARVISAVERPAQVAVFSGRTSDAAIAEAGTYARFLETHPAVSLEDFCHTVTSARTHFSHRGGVVARSREELIQALADFAAGKAPAGVFLRRAGKPGRRNQLVMGFGARSGLDAVGRELLNTQPTFKSALESIGETVRPYLSAPVMELVGAGNLSGADAAFVALALELALLELWNSWGLRADAVMGRDVGEYAAAVATRVFSLDDACKLLAARVAFEAAGSGDTSGLQAAAAQVKYSGPRVPFLGANGEKQDEAVASAAYWSGAELSTGALLETAVMTGSYAESALLLLGAEKAPGASSTPRLASLTVGASDWDVLAGSVLQLHIAGVEVDWKRFDQPYARTRVVVPTYPFQRKRYWVSPESIALAE
jgi:acyl transferase domain-containing protein